MATVRERIHSSSKVTETSSQNVIKTTYGHCSATNGSFDNGHYGNGDLKDATSQDERRKSGWTGTDPLATSGTSYNNRIRVFKNVQSFTNRLVATDTNFQAVHDIVMIHFVLFICYMVIKDSLQAGRFFLDLRVLSAGTGSVAVFFLVEFYLLASFLLVHPAFKVWEYFYTHGGVSRSFCVALFVSLYISYIGSSGVMVAWISLALPLAPFTVLILSVEQIRLCMKSYSFVRESVYKVLYPWQQEDRSGPAVWYNGQMSPRVGTFSQYLYFLFAPTFLYRDHYPRNAGPIKWHNALAYMVQFIGTIWYLSFLIKELTFPSSLSWSHLMGAYLNCVLCAFLGYVLVHTCIFHAYLNMVSELLRFADREFYEDWWTCTSFSSYYRKWNRIVHDWIHTYLYTDLKNLFKSPIPAVFATTLVSAFIHEYLLALVLKFASPMLLLEFAGLGMMFYLLRPYKKRRLSNLMVLLCLCVGGSNLVFYYEVELVSRMHCPRELTLWTFFKPRMFECFYDYHHGNSSSF